MPAAHAVSTHMRPWNVVSSGAYTVARNFSTADEYSSLVMKPLWDMFLTDLLFLTDEFLLESLSPPAAADIIFISLK